MTSNISNRSEHVIYRRPSGVTTSRPLGERARTVPDGFSLSLDPPLNAGDWHS